MPIFLVSFCKLATQAWCTFFREKNFYCSPHFPLYERRKSIFESHSLRKKRGETSPLSPPPSFLSDLRQWFLLSHLGRKGESYLCQENLRTGYHFDWARKDEKKTNICGMQKAKFSCQYVLILSQKGKYELMRSKTATVPQQQKKRRWHIR